MVGISSTLCTELLFLEVTPNGLKMEVMYAKVAVIGEPVEK